MNAVSSITNRRKASFKCKWGSLVGLVLSGIINKMHVEVLRMQ